ncbi:TPA: NO-inducible flavohemoprotein [Pasteurella multocida]|uniref:NO-inducible flavohemoprotein n=1 Tax=Pasteurella multocida TaxID=747 RepID=UPI000CE8A0D1|nr:NO-inducible flavohemoprotein [Pasteurella multocida]MDY0578487.1 NO-inducible flavohemoprotein [Pasteurella multocida]MEB3450149.1 NO-inducible flavohemoprotein [Pasteurella multocida]MEB3452987.1 NO-inducible flavohemoprotein [Pasteurella multocida]MEB3454328.1 NO-inducible flavohemoprotein [Pasteurella multocida]MEB3458786.1 NO-inducible flavohemoprotein [Pasteurella multocida]
MLDQHTRDIIKATIPVLEQYGTTITQTFYHNMFTAHPELLDVFNKTNQKQGRQPMALASTVLAAAKHIDNLEAILPHITQIGHKHRALEIKPEHYPIVGENLLKAIKEVLGDAATPEIIDAWGKAYGVIADVFIQVEQTMYDKAAWEGYQPFKVVNKRVVSDQVVEFTVKPDFSLPDLQAGQYITVRVKPEGEENTAWRHYSLCSINTTEGLKFAVKREGVGECKGLVSHYLHDHIQIGDTLDLTAPAGDFVLKQDDKPLVLISGGIGITPLLAMLEQQINVDHQREIHWIHSCRHADNHAFKDEVESLIKQAGNAQQHLIYTAEQPRIDATFITQHLPKEASIYVCGSIGFMEGIIALLKQQGWSESDLRFEPFGPKMSVVTV